MKVPFGLRDCLAIVFLFVLVSSFPIGQGRTHSAPNKETSKETSTGSSATAVDFKPVSNGDLMRLSPESAPCPDVERSAQ